MSRAARRAVMQESLRNLKLPSVLRDYEDRARQAQDGQWDYEDYLRELTETEINDREARTVQRRLKAARFPDHKTFEQIDWKALSGVSKPKLNELASCEYIDRGDDVVLVGPIGTGKTHLAIALGIEAAKRRYRVLFVKASDLVRDLLEAREKRSSDLGSTSLHQTFRVAALSMCVHDWWSTVESIEKGHGRVGEDEGNTLQQQNPYLGAYPGRYDAEQLYGY